MNCGAASQQVAKLLVVVSIAAGSLAFLNRLKTEQPAARFARQIEWVGKGVWLKADTHTHTVFSDGLHSVDEVVGKAQGFGCDVIAITDHSGHGLDAAKPEYFDAINAARRAYPGVIIFAGLEWTVPVWKGKEHATVLAAPGARGEKAISDFKTRFDGSGRTHVGFLPSAKALRWLELETKGSQPTPVVLYNHVSRKQADPNQTESLLRHWVGVSGLVAGFSGAPGHQGRKPLGGYRLKGTLIDRWDRAAARVGGVWDRLLQSGVDVWAARAPSDFHSPNPKRHGDYWPGQFSETWLYAPDRTAQGALQALRAGSFFAAHGHIAQRVVLSVLAPGLERAAWPGEAIEVAAHTQVTVLVDLVIPERDWAGQPNKIDSIELIAITAGGVSVVAKRPPSDQQHAFIETIEVPEGGIVLRARGRRKIEDGPDLMFYTNPVRVMTPPTR